MLLHEMPGLTIKGYPDSEPPVLQVTSRVGWLVWFLNNKADISMALERLTREPFDTNVLILANDGSGLTRRADQTTESMRDISLAWVVRMLKNHLEPATPALLSRRSGKLAFQNKNATHLTEETMSIEKTAQPQTDVENPSPSENAGDVDWTGLTPASNAGTREEPRQAKHDLGEEVVERPDYPGIGANTDNSTPMPPEAHTRFPAEPERGVNIERSPEPDERDDEKVERLAAPDWRSDQPLPSAQNAIDPRGENTPSEMFETDEGQKQDKNKTRKTASKSGRNKTI